MQELLSSIPESSKTLLIIWVVTLITSVTLYFFKNKYWKYTLAISALSLAAAFALFTPFLYTWDEQFHALVAKNSSVDPFHPKLYFSEPVGLKNVEWSETTTWLHKQPLFTWLMAISVKIAGTSAFAIRLPSVILHAILVLVIHRIGKITFNEKVGFFAAVVFMHSAYLLSLISGLTGTDHNDYIFMAFVTLSFWAYLEWRESELKKWVIWIGIFVGMAVLTKWLVGLLVFFGWGVVFLIELFKFKKTDQFFPILKALGISIFVFLPWQIYTFIRFPDTAKHEMQYNSRHIWEPIEGHSGNVDYHWDKISDLYFHRFDLILLLLVSVAFLFFRKIDWKKSVFLISSILIVYLFFTLVQTKMPSFTVPAMPLVIVLLSFGITELISFIRWKGISIGLTVLFLSLMVNLFLKPETISENYGFKAETENYGRRKLYQKQYEFILENYSPEKRIVFGCDLRGEAHASWMFFNNDLAYKKYPDSKTIQRLVKNGYQILLIDWHGSVPENIRTEPGAKVIEFPD